MQEPRWIRTYRLALGLLVVWVSHWYRRPGDATPTMRTPRQRAPGPAAPVT